MPTTKRKLDDFASVKLPVDFHAWIVEVAATEGKFQYFKILELVTKALGGKQPWKGDK